MSYVFKSNSDNVLKIHERMKDMLFAHMSMDVEIGIKTTAGTPVSNTVASGNKRGGGGHMKAEARHFKAPDGKWRVEVNKDYAAYQEKGARQDGSHVVRNYSTPGTSAGWFQRAIDGVWAHRDNYVIQVRRALGL